MTILGCASAPESVLSHESARPNVLLIIADDLGKDALSGFIEGTLKAKTPNLDSLRLDGLSFENLWSYPTCTPTRASIITGKYGLRTGMKRVRDVLGTSEITLQHFIKQQTHDAYSTAIIGKWHLSGTNNEADPESYGMDYYSGVIRGIVNDYYNWTLTEDRETKVVETYASEFLTDLSINWIHAQEKPWFLWLAYNAPHTPFHIPPSDMHSQGNLPEYNEAMNPLPYYLAAIEAMDFQIGRLLEAIPEEDRNNTIIIFMGDNGTPRQVSQYPYGFSKAKNTLYQGGINVPMIISGYGVKRIGKDGNLLVTSDLFATISEIVGVKINERYDSKSFKCLLTDTSKVRDYQFSEMHLRGIDSWAISDGNYKLIEDSEGNQELYNLNIDPYENNNLIKSIDRNDLNATDKLKTELARIRQ